MVHLLGPYFCDRPDAARATYAGESLGLDNIVGRIFFWGGSRSIFRIEEKLHKNCTKTNRNYTNMLVAIGV